MDRELLTARLTGKRLIAAPSQTYLLDFELDVPFEFLPGQFVSVVFDSEYPEGHPKAGQPRQETRAYSLADAPRGNQVQLCLNCVGDFSRKLCALNIDTTIHFHGPHGTFTRREGQQPSLYFGAEAGIVPIRSIFREAVPANSTLMQTAATRDDLLFRDEFGTAPDVRYLPLVAPGDDFIAAQVRKLLTEHTEIQTAYLCGLNAAIGPVRELLKSLGWERKQIVFERYD
ncbi:MAG: FAD-dependent oxidoreductase [Acidobacteria bacterium]|nr:FAD-dependent oxidoreductase [Acidobacteriota bacterium]